MDRLHFRELGQRRDRDARRLRRALHLSDRQMHPHQCDGNQGEQQPEATLPDAGQVVQRTEGYRQDEAAQTAD